MSIDDGSKEDIKIAKLCLKYGVKAVFYWPVDMYGLSIQKGWDSLNPKDEEWIAQNFEIGSHTISHRYLTKIPQAEAFEEVIESRDILRSKYHQDINKFCYPRGYANEDIIIAVKEAGYNYARSTHIGHIGKPNNPFFASTAVHMGCPLRAEYIGSNWFDYGMKLLEKAKKLDSDGDFEYSAWCHGWEITRYNEWENVEKFIKILGSV